MIVARLESKEHKNEEMLLLILEPANLEKIKAGEPILKSLNRFLPGLSDAIQICIAYTPDIQWVADEAQKCAVLDAETLAEVITESRKRPAIVRDSEDAEALERAR